MTTKVGHDLSALTGPERAVVFAGAVVFHAGLLALLLSVSPEATIPDARSGVMSLIQVAPLAARSKPPPPVLPSNIGDERPVVAKEIAAEIESGEAGATEGCATLDLINKAIVSDPAAVTAVLASPRESRSVSEAVILWNNGWIGYAAGANAPLAPARAVVEQNLSSLGPECLDEVIVGPRLVAIPAGSGTMFLVIGSGAWTWRQLLDRSNAIAAGKESRPQPVPIGLREWF